MNLPNKLTILRIVLVPFLLVMIYNIGDSFLMSVLTAMLFLLISFTDMLDGKIARKYNLITNFGKFIDPLADKFMVLGSMFAILAWMLLRGETTVAIIYVFVALLILLRELGVTSIRLVVAGKDGIVVAASILGKIKTVSQMVGTVIIIVEPILPFFGGSRVLSYIGMGVMLFTTMVSGIDYLKAYLPYIDSNK